MSHEEVREDRETLFAALNTASLAFDEMLHTLVQLCNPGILGRVDVFGSEFVERVDTGKKISKPDDANQTRLDTYLN